MPRKEVIIVNFKTYSEASGANALKLAKICEQVAVEYSADIRVAVQALDLAKVASSVRIPVLAQHVDGIPYGAHTGAIIPEAILEAGGKGSLLNHSEWRIPIANIEAAVLKLRRLGMDSVVCADNLVNAKKVMEVRPSFLAIEPPELIGGTMSVSVAEPELITSITNKAHAPVLCGAGIHTGEDVRKAFELGVDGILVASGIVLSKNPSQVLTDFVKGMQNK